MHRHIALERASNFRDIGGYATRFGPTVRWERVYRGGELTRITDADVAVLDALGLELVFDLRTSSERAQRPSRIWTTAPRRLHRDYDHSGADLPSMVAARLPTAEALRDSMMRLYRHLPFDQADAFRVLLEAIAHDDLPLAFHCAGGKDRTGAFAAILLELLGVSHADIVADYLLSNDGIDAARARFLAHVGRDDIDPSTWDPMLIVAPEYLEAMFAAMAQRHGDTAGYVASLGITLAQLAAIRANLLEPQ